MTRLWGGDGLRFFRDKANCYKADPGVKKNTALCVTALQGPCRFILFYLERPPVQYLKPWRRGGNAWRSVEHLTVLRTRRPICKAQHQTAAAPRYRPYSQSFTPFVVAGFKPLQMSWDSFIGFRVSLETKKECHGRGNFNRTVPKTTTSRSLC